MKNTYLALTTAAMLTASAAFSEDLAATKARQLTSVTQGFAASSLPTLQRAAASDPKTLTSALVQKLRLTGASEAANLGVTSRVTGDQWSLEVSNDGSFAEFHNHAAEAQAHSLGVSASKQMSEAALEQKGRAFIAANLASQITLSKSEALVALRADYRTDGGQDLATGATTTAVVANRIVFGRTINGVPVVGNGSKVILTFNNDGSLSSLRYDWPTYQTGLSQSVVTPQEVLSRVQAVMGVRNGNTTATKFVMALPARGTMQVFPLALAGNIQLQSLDCGYYDPGFSAKMPGSIQSGCTYLAVSQDSAGARSGFAGAVPAAMTIKADPAWMESQILTAKQ